MPVPIDGAPQAYVEPTGTEPVGVKENADALHTVVACDTIFALGLTATVTVKAGNTLEQKLDAGVTL
jgi:hypothetical protein